MSTSCWLVIRLCLLLTLAFTPKTGGAQNTAPERDERLDRLRRGRHPGFTRRCLNWNEKSGQGEQFHRPERDYEVTLGRTGGFLKKAEC